MFPCAVCHKVFDGLNNVLTHMRLFHSIPPNGYLCKFTNCGRSYDSLDQFRSHLKKYHVNGGDYVHFPPRNAPDLPNNFQMNVDEVGLAVDEVEPDLVVAAEPVTLESVTNSISKAALNFASQLYSIDTVNRTDVDVIVTMTSQFVCSAVSSIRSKFQHLDDPETEEIFDVLATSFQGLLTESQRFDALQSTSCFLKPETINIDYGQDIINIPDRDLAQIPLTGQFVPLRHVLKNFFELPDVFELTVSNYNNLILEVNTFSNVVQGSLWKNVIAPKFEGKLVLPLNLYYDDFEPDNVVGSHQGDHKIGGTYYNCPVIPQKFLGSLKNIFVAELILSDDRNVIDGNHKVFHKLLQELKFLEEEGILIQNNNEEIRIFFALTLILGDNLGIHSILGFAEGFTANFPCRMCRMHRDLVRRMLYVPVALLRNPHNYAEDVATNDQILTGVFEECIFNELESYHAVVNLSPDVMHDILEGIAKYDMCKIMEYLVYTREYFSLDILKQRVNDFDYGPLEKGNKPPSHKITRERLVNESLNFSSAEMLCLVRFFGMMVGDLVPIEDPVWEFYLSLRKILDIIFAPSFALGTEDLLKLYIEIHHRLYLENFDVHLKPKYHFLLHYAFLMKLIGPLLHSSSMRWESKHREFKKVARATSCRKNLPLTLITKHLLKLSFRFLSGNGFQMDYDLGVSLLVPRLHVDPDNVIDQFIDLHPVPNNLDSLSWVCLNGVRYTKGLVLHCGFSSDYPSFGVIDFIIYLGLSDRFEPRIVFVCHKLMTRAFNRHIFAYQVTETHDWFALPYEDIFSPHPMSMRDSPVGGLYVSPRHML